MATLSSLIPNPEELIGLSVEDLACPLLKVIDSLADRLKHRHNYLNSVAVEGYPLEHHEQVKQVVNEAWEWLRSQGYIAPRAEGSQPEFIEITRRGRKFLEDCSTHTKPIGWSPRQESGNTESSSAVSAVESLKSEVAALPDWARRVLVARCAMRALPLFVPDENRPTQDAKRDLTAVDMCWKLAGLAAFGRFQAAALVERAASLAEDARNAASDRRAGAFDAAELAGFAARIATGNGDSAPGVVADAVTAHELAFARFAGAIGLGAGISLDATRSLNDELGELKGYKAIGTESREDFARRVFNWSLWRGATKLQETLAPLLNPWRLRLLELGLIDIYNRYVPLLYGTRSGIDWKGVEIQISEWANEQFAEPSKTQPTTKIPGDRATADSKSHYVPGARRPSLSMLADSALEDDSEDRLGFKAYARALAGLITNPETTTPLTLSINAPWGAGKTTLARMLERILKRSPIGSRKSLHVTCWFNAWMHDDAPNLASAFAAEIAQAADKARPFWSKVIKPVPGNVLPIPGRLRHRLLLWASGAVLFIFIVAKLRFPNWFSHFEVRAPAYIAAIVAAVQPLRALAPFAKSVANFVKDPKSTAASASMNQVSQELGQLIEQATPQGGRFVIFIDDLERCRPPRAVDVLEVVNQLLGHEGVVTIIIGDMPAVAACAAIKYKELAMRYTPSGMPCASAKNQNGSIYGHEFLQKIIQLQFDLPKYSSEEMQSLMEGLLTRSDSERSSTNAGHSGILLGAWKAIRLILTGRAELKKIPERVENEIASQIASGTRDMAAVEEAVSSTFKRSPDYDPLVEDLIRERIQLRLSDDSEIMNEAQAEAMRYVQPFPRHAKRLLNRLRLLLFVAHERRMFGGDPPLTPRHIGKWAVLCERWPELAQALTVRPTLMSDLEDPFEGQKAGGDIFYQTVKAIAPSCTDDSELQGFCRSRDLAKLAPVLTRIVRFQPADGQESRAKEENE